MLLLHALRAGNDLLGHRDERLGVFRLRVEATVEDGNALDGAAETAVAGALVGPVVAAEAVVLAGHDRDELVPLAPHAAEVAGGVDHLEFGNGGADAARDGVGRTIEIRHGNEVRRGAPEAIADVVVDVDVGLDGILTEVQVGALHVVEGAGRGADAEAREAAADSHALEAHVGFGELGVVLDPHHHGVLEASGTILTVLAVADARG